MEPHKYLKDRSTYEGRYDLEYVASGRFTQEREEEKTRATTARRKQRK
jgi:hypothetical protein